MFSPTPLGLHNLIRASFGKKKTLKIKLLSSVTARMTSRDDRIEHLSTMGPGAGAFLTAQPRYSSSQLSYHICI